MGKLLNIQSLNEDELNQYKTFFNDFIQNNKLYCFDRNYATPLGIITYKDGVYSGDFDRVDTTILYANLPKYNVHVILHGDYNIYTICNINGQDCYIQDSNINL